MSTKAMVKPLRREIPVLCEKAFMSTCIHFESGSNMLTSLCHEEASRLLSHCKNNRKGRLRRKTDGSIELVNSVWGEYGDTHTDLHDINDLIKIKDRITSISAMRSGCQEDIVIIDWGCGSGHTLAQLGNWLERENISHVQLYGYANEIHPDWQFAPANITFILDVADNLPMYFNNGTVDFIYSIAGLYYLFLPEYDDHDDDMVEYFKKHEFNGQLFKNYAHTEKHLEQLCKIMKSRSELIIDLPIHVIDIDFNLLQSESLKYKSHRNPDKYGEHAYVLVPRTPAPTGPGENIDNIFRLIGQEDNRLHQAQSYG